jgi:KDO2-lipid IV(A) lauroyltransferase
MSHRSATRNRLELLVYLAARTVACRLGPAALARLGAMIGEIYLLVGRSRGKILGYNLGLAFPELTLEQRRRLAHQVARHFGRAALDTLRLQHLDPDQLLAETTVKGQHHLETARNRGRGVLLLSAHIGAWEVAALVAGLLLPGGLAIVNRPLDNPLLETELKRFRTSFGNQLLGKSNVTRAVLSRARSGGAIGFLIDQRCSEREGIQVPFFGQPSWTHPMLARLALRTAAPVVPIWGLWQEPARYLVRFGQPVYADALAAAQRNEADLTAHLLRITETIIRQHPEQWLWYHDRWRQLREAVTPIRPAESM